MRRGRVQGQIRGSLVSEGEQAPPYSIVLILVGLDEGWITFEDLERVRGRSVDTA